MGQSAQLSVALAVRGGSLVVSVPVAAPSRGVCLSFPVTAVGAPQKALYWVGQVILAMRWRMCRWRRVSG